MIRNPCLIIRKSVDNVSSVLRVGASKNVKSMLILDEIAAIRCHILKLKCTKFDFGWGSAPDPLEEVTGLPQVS